MFIFSLLNPNWFWIYMIDISNKNVSKIVLLKNGMKEGKLIAFKCRNQLDIQMSQLVSKLKPCNLM